MTPGLANKIAIPSAAKYAVIFLKHWIAFRKGKPSLQVLRFDRNFSQAIKIAAMDLCKFTADKPVILVIGGSLGSVVVNNAVRESLPCLLKDFQIIHLCGKGKTMNL